jgi:hypothetical protein
MEGPGLGGWRRLGLQINTAVTDIKMVTESMHVHQSACREARQERRGLDLNLKQLYY